MKGKADFVSAYCVFFENVTMVSKYRIVVIQVNSIRSLSMFPKPRIIQSMTHSHTGHTNEQSWTDNRFMKDRNQKGTSLCSTGLHHC